MCASTLSRHTVAKRSLHCEIWIDHHPPDETTLAVNKDNPALAAEQADLVAQRLSKLPPKKAVAFNSLFEGHSQEEAATEAGVTVRTLHVWAHQGPHGSR